LGAETSWDRWTLFLQTGIQNVSDGLSGIREHNDPRSLGEKPPKNPRSERHAVTIALSLRIAHPNGIVVNPQRQCVSDLRLLTRGYVESFAQEADLAGSSVYGDPPPPGSPLPSIL
jgi:hypothetical protein